MKKSHIQIYLGNVRLKKSKLAFYSFGFIFFVFCVLIGVHLRVSYTDAYYDPLQGDRAHPDYI